MSTAESEVAEAIVEKETPEELQTVDQHPNDFDMDAAVDSLAQDLFPNAEKKDEGETVEEVVEETTEEISETPEEPEEPEVELKDAPQSWKKEMHDSWNDLKPDVQEYIELREEQMKEGIDVRKEDAEVGMKFRDAFSPFESAFKQMNNVDPVQAAQRVMATHLRLATAPPEQRKQLFDQLAQSYGISNEPVDEATQKLRDNPEVQALKQKLSQLENYMNASYSTSQQEKEQRINSEVEDFAGKHDHFDDLSDEIAKLIRADYSLDDAYKMAYNNSPFFEQDLEREREKKAKAEEKARKQEAEKAKKAKTVNVRGRDTGKTPTAPKGTMEDTMKEVMREIKNRP